MPRCPACDGPLRGDPARLGARCPHCHEPLYEPPVVPRPAAGSEEGHCATHEHNVSVGTCKRCGNFLCSVCRTRWQGRAVCIACIERALESDEATPASGRLQWTHAAFALVLGLGAWGLAVLGMILLIGGAEDMNRGLAMMGVLLFFGSGMPAVVGLGLAASAIRARGSHMIVATLGLFLSGLELGVLIGLIGFGLWQM